MIHYSLTALGALFLLAALGLYIYRFKTREYKLLHSAAFLFWLTYLALLVWFFVKGTLRMEHRLPRTMCSFLFLLIAERTARIMPISTFIVFGLAAVGYSLGFVWSTTERIEMEFAVNLYDLVLTFYIAFIATQVSHEFLANAKPATLCVRIIKLWILVTALWACSAIFMPMTFGEGWDERQKSAHIVTSVNVLLYSCMYALQVFWVVHSAGILVQSVV